MNKTNFEAFLRTIESNLSAYTVNPERFSNQEHNLIVAVIDSDNKIVNFCLGTEVIPKILLDAYGLKKITLGAVTPTGIKVTRPMNEVSKHFKIDLSSYFTQGGLKRNQMFSEVEPEQEHDLSHIPDQLSEIIGTLFSDESHSSDPEAEYQHEEINWSGDLYNAYGPVSYKRKEGDEESGTRMIKLTHQGQVMKYPVHSETGYPIFEGLDPEVFAVHNTSLADEEQVNNDVNVDFAREQLLNLFPNKAELINQFASQLKH
jgi:hypothetical protein